MQRLQLFDYVQVCVYETRTAEALGGPRRVVSVALAPAAHPECRAEPLLPAVAASCVDREGGGLYVQSAVSCATVFLGACGVLLGRTRRVPGPSACRPSLGGTVSVRGQPVHRPRPPRVHLRVSPVGPSVWSGSVVHPLGLGKAALMLSVCLRPTVDLSTGSAFPPQDRWTAEPAPNAVAEAA